MEREVWEKQIDRIKATWGERYYPHERVALFYRVFQNTSVADFADAIDNLIANRTHPPLLEELSKAVEAAKVRRNQAQRDGLSIAGIMQLAQRVNTDTDRDFVRSCIRLFREKNSNVISSEEFEKSCHQLDALAESLKRHKNMSDTPHNVVDKYLGEKSDE